MTQSSNSLSSGSQSGRDGRAPPAAAVASAAFSSEAAATGASGGNSFFSSVPNGEFIWRRELSHFSPGGYGSTAAAVARVASERFIYRPMGFAIWPVSVVPRIQPTLSIEGESETMESSIVEGEGECGGGSGTTSIPAVWRADQWLDALAGDELSSAARERGQRILLRAISSPPPRPLIQLEGGRNSRLEEEDDISRGREREQGRES